jgi:hypothetical protein
MPTLQTSSLFATTNFIIRDNKDTTNAMALMPVPPATAPAATPAGSSWPTALTNNDKAAPTAAGLPPPLPNNTGAPLLDVSILDSNNSAIRHQTGSSYAYDIFHNVIANWINDDRLVKINGIEFCSNDEEMQKVAMQFSISSNRILNGCTGAIMVGL